MNISIEEQLLNASLLCGLRPEQQPAYRLQLFFIANKDLSSKSHQSDFQRALETGVNEKRLWENYIEKGSGEYLITELGYNRAVSLFGKIEPIYLPVYGKDYHIEIVGKINNMKIKLETKGSGQRSTTVYINNKAVKSAKEACRIIEMNTKLYLPTKNESAVRVLYNMAIDYDFELIWRGSVRSI